MTAPRALPTPAPTEAEWQAVVIDAAHALGWHHNFTRRSIGKGRKWTTATSCVGWPDLTLWHEGQRRVIFAELKTDKGETTAQQDAVLISLYAAGAEVRVWKTGRLGPDRQRFAGGRSWVSG